jgi:hypothetical protein
LEGDKDCSKKTTPKFERGKIVITDKNIDIYISGTAAILGEKTIDKSDISSQTQTTISNILKLISQENIRKCVPKEYHSRLSYNVAQLSYLRAYVKKERDIPRVQNICKQYFHDTPSVFLSADICRDDLLVEIEGGIFI